MTETDWRLHRNFCMWLGSVLVELVLEMRRGGGTTRERTGKPICLAARWDEDNRSRRREPRILQLALSAFDIGRRSAAHLGRIADFRCLFDLVLNACGGILRCRIDGLRHRGASQERGTEDSNQELR